MAKENNEWNDWIGELFTPSYDVTVEDMLDRPQDKETTIKSKVKLVSALDPDTIKDAFERVRVTCVLAEEMRKKAAKQESPKGIQKEEGTDDQPGKKEEKIVDVDQPGIWDTNELATLRQVFKTIKQHNRKLKVINTELEKRNEELENEVANLKLHLNKKNHELTEASKSNKRLKILSDQLQHDLDYITARMTAMEQIFKEINEEKSKMVKENQEMKIAVDKERMDRERIECQFKSLEQQALCEKMAMEQTIKMECQSEISKLHSRINDLSDELNKEKKLHYTTKRGLEHLRQHFASLPLSNIIPPNAVKSDQISKFSYT
ncbi:tropomyosin alpha-1 chain-like [Mytilus edulis]|uniref:tropomyosin alpha-1 chain-like n=1 Tax=Mytilus edulis TaxID=6550 RepID=UPI0039EE1AB4